MYIYMCVYVCVCVCVCACLCVCVCVCVRTEDRSSAHLAGEYRRPGHRRKIPALTPATPVSYFAEMCSGPEEGADARLIDCCIAQLWAREKKSQNTSASASWRHAGASIIPSINAHRAQPRNLQMTIECILHRPQHQSIPRTTKEFADEGLIQSTAAPI